MLPAAISNNLPLVQMLRYDRTAMPGFAYKLPDAALKKDIDSLLKDISHIIESGKKIYLQAVKLLEQLFNIRLKAIKWLVQNSDFNLLQISNEVYLEIGAVKANGQFAVLTENIRFALRCIQKVLHGLLGNEATQTSNLPFKGEQFAEITYKQFLVSLSLAIPNEDVAQKTINFINASLLIEFVVIAAFIIEEEGFRAPGKTIKELSFLAANFGQEYIALATELSILPPHLNPQTLYLQLLKF